MNDKTVQTAFRNHDIVIPGGESINQLNTRYIEGLKTIAYKYSYERVAIISHSAAISNVKALLTGDKYEDIDYCVIYYNNNEYKVMEYGKYE